MYSQFRFRTGVLPLFIRQKIHTKHEDGAICYNGTWPVDGQGFLEIIRRFWLKLGSNKAFVTVEVEC